MQASEHEREKRNRMEVSLYRTDSSLRGERPGVKILEEKKGVRVW